MSKELEEQRDELAGVLEDFGLGEDDGDFGVEDLEVLRAGKTPEVEEDEPKVEKTEEKSSPVEAKPRLRDDIRAQLEFGKAASESAKSDPDAEKFKDFDLEKWAELVKSDPRAAFEMSTEHVLRMEKPGERIKGAISRLDKLELDRQQEAAGDFIDSNPDYPHQDAEVNAFMERALANLNLSYTKRNLQRVWNEAKKGGYIVGLEEKKEEVKTEAKAPKTKAKVPPRTPPSRSTGAIDESSNPFGDKLLRAAEKMSIDDFDTDFEKFRDIGATQPGFTSRVSRTGLIDAD